jgi:hypothetical protein
VFPFLWIICSYSLFNKCSLSSSCMPAIVLVTEDMTVLSSGGKHTKKVISVVVNFVSTWLGYKGCQISSKTFFLGISVRLFLKEIINLCQDWVKICPLQYEWEEKEEEEEEKEDQEKKGWTLTLELAIHPLRPWDIVNSGYQDLGLTRTYILASPGSRGFSFVLKLITDFSGLSACRWWVIELLRLHYCVRQSLTLIFSLCLYRWSLICDSSI